MPFDFSKVNFRKVIRKGTGQKDTYKRKEKLSPRESAFRRAFKKKEAEKARRKKDKTLK